MVYFEGIFLHVRVVVSSHERKQFQFSVSILKGTRAHVTFQQDRLKLVTDYLLEMLIKVVKET